MVSLRVVAAGLATAVLALSGCSSSGSEAVRACWDHVRADPKNSEAVSGLSDGKLKTLDSNATKDGDEWTAVGKAAVGEATVEFGCLLDTDLNVTYSKFGPEGSIDTQ